MSLSPRGTWKMHLYGATNDNGSATPYDTVLLSTISGYAGYATKSVYITQSGDSWELESFNSTDVSGSVFGTTRRRRTFRVMCFPFTFESGTIQDLEDIADLTSLIDTKAYLWVRFEAGSRAQPSTTTAFPVYIESFAEDVRSGVHGVTIDLKHRYRF